jgi:hypothetical protein
MPRVRPAPGTPHGAARAHSPCGHAQVELTRRGLFFGAESKWRRAAPPAAQQAAQGFRQGTNMLVLALTQPLPLLRQLQVLTQLVQCNVSIT